MPAPNSNIPAEPRRSGWLVADGQNCLIGMFVDPVEFRYFCIQARDAGYVEILEKDGRYNFVPYPKISKFYLNRAR